MFEIIFYDVFKYINVNLFALDMETYKYALALGFVLCLSALLKYSTYALEHTTVGYMICDKMNGVIWVLFNCICTSKVKFIMEIDGVEYTRIEPCDRFELDIWLTYFAQYSFSKPVEFKSKSGDIKWVGIGPYTISKHINRFFAYPSLTIWLS